MALNIQEKKIILSEISEIAKNALSIVVVDPRGINVNKITELRKISRKSNVFLRMFRNTLLRIAVKSTNFECLKESFIGPSLIACSMKHPGTAARLFKEFAKENPSFKIKAAVFEKVLIPGCKIDYLATIPTYEESIIRLMVTIKEASIGKIIRIIVAIYNIKKNI